METKPLARCLLQLQLQLQLHSLRVILQKRTHHVLSIIFPQHCRNRAHEPTPSTFSAQTRPNSPPPPQDRERKKKTNVAKLPKKYPNEHLSTMCPFWLPKNSTTPPSRLITAPLPHPPPPPPLPPCAPPPRTPPRSGVVSSAEVELLFLYACSLGLVYFFFLSFFL